ncbi:hypothetical protein WJX75_004053 [Coccomyxa subellipsoidea]|uniref:Uncharacterized protein n=1 Tax=Coccomyxa subellipsoidea TaxID=248742 RepID=A0ABR2Z397_9CHLO
MLGMQSASAVRPVRPNGLHHLGQPGRSVRPFIRYLKTRAASRNIPPQAREDSRKGEQHLTRRAVSGAVLLGVPISYLFQGAAHAGLAADAIKETDPSIDTVSPPKIGDAVESRAKVAGSTMEASPPSDVGQALREGVTRMEVPDPLKTVLPGKNSGFQVNGIGEEKKSNKIRDAIVDKALTDQSPKRNFGK